MNNHFKLTKEQHSAHTVLEEKSFQHLSYLKLKINSSVQKFDMISHHK